MCVCVHVCVDESMSSTKGVGFHHPHMVLTGFTWSPWQQGVDLCDDLCWLHECDWTRLTCHGPRASVSPSLMLLQPNQIFFFYEATAKLKPWSNYISEYISIQQFIYSHRFMGIVFGSQCLSVCLTTRKIKVLIGQILMKFSGNVYNRPKKSWLNLGEVPDSRTFFLTFNLQFLSNNMFTSFCPMKAIPDGPEIWRLLILIDSNLN